MTIYAVDKNQMNILVELFEKDYLDDYFLVGGTNLALRLNHRHSIDIDLFASKNFDRFDSQILDVKLKESFASRYNLVQISEVGVFCIIDEIKVDIVKYPYALIKPLVKIDKLRLADFEDIAAMKVSAVTGRGSKKDFYYIYELLHLFTVEQMIGFYSEKFQINNLFHVRKSLNYFADAEDSEIRNNTVESLKKLSWKEVKNYINKKVIESHKHKFGKKP